MVVARSVLLGVMVWLGEVEVEFLLTFLVDMMTPIFLFMGERVQAVRIMQELLGLFMKQYQRVLSLATII
jgi:hypothetical protein